LRPFVAARKNMWCASSGSIYLSITGSALVSVEECPNKGEDCGGSSQYYHTIYIYPYGFQRQGKEIGCGCLESQIYHELLHEISRSMTHNVIENYVMKCFEDCARWHDPGDYPDYAPPIYEPPKK